MDPDDKLRRLMQESGILNEWCDDAEDELEGNMELNNNTRGESLRLVSVDARNDQINGSNLPSCISTITSRSMRLSNDNLINIEIGEPSNTCDGSVQKRKLNSETGCFESDTESDDTHIVSSAVNKKLNAETGLFESDSEIENANIITPCVGNNKKIRLNYETGIFKTDSDISINNSNEGTTKKGKKRLSRPETWEKNVQVKNKLKDHVVSEIKDCRCRCKEKLSKQSINKVFQKFINLGSHTEQNIYLQGCLQEQVPKRYRPRNDSNVRNRRLFRYFVTIRNKSVEVCQKTFLAIHGIKRDRLQCKVQHPEKDITDGRGRHPSRVIYNESVIKKIHEFIESIPARSSHYCRSSSKSRKYLDSHLSIAALHRKFLEENADVDCTVTYEKFREIFNTDFNISFATPRKDICSTCEKFVMDIQSAELNKDRETARRLKLQRDLHLRKAEVFLKNCSYAENNQDETKLSICFDYQKNLPLPVTNVSDEYYLRQLWLHNFGIHNLKDNTATMYMYTENNAKKGPNEVLSALNDYILHNAKPNHKHLEIFCDNCFSQNKNKFLITFLDQLCATGKFERISVYYPIPGHSMMPIDRDFALIEKQRLKREKIYSPETYVMFVKDCKITKKFEVVYVEKHLGKTSDSDRVIKVKDYKKLLEDKIKATIPGIATCRRLKFTRFSIPEMSDTMTGDNFKSVRLYRVGMQRRLRDTPDDCYFSMLKVKDAKINDIKKLMKYVPQDERAFYEEIFQNMAMLDNVNDDDSCDDIE